MRRVLVISLVLAAACGGVQVPSGNGYKSDKVKPWKKAKTLKFDDKLEAKVDGDLSYPAMKRAAWYGIDLQSPAEVDLRLEITPPGDAVNDDFDLAWEILDPGYRVIAKSDLEDEDAHEQTKTKTLKDLTPGRYLVHLYLQGRLDTADYTLSAAIKPSSGDIGHSDFPAQVAFPGPLPVVPIEDDTPASYHPPVATNTGHKPRGGHKTHDPEPPKPPDPPPTATKSASIIGLAASGDTTTVTVSLGTANNVSAGMKLKIPGLSEVFTLADCKPRTCTATVHARPDQIKASATVTISP